ncbi:hypothetical protein E4U55_008202 [Claviceps digitariae]|nr:hypothetical protein E4U55_008202 [Claviceps digitariae]
MLFSVYLTLLLVSGQHVYGNVVASSPRNQQQEPATAKGSVSLLGLEELSVRKTRRHIRSIGALASSLRAGHAQRLRISSRDTRHEQVAVLDVSLQRNNEATAGPHYPHAEEESKRQVDSYSPTSKHSVILVGEKDKLWNNIGLATGIIATLASCIVLGILFLWLSRRKQECRKGKVCQNFPVTGQSPVASIQRHELFVPGTPNPAWQPPPYHAFRHIEQQQPSGTTSVWMPHNVVSPIDSSDGSTPLSNWYVAQHSGKHSSSLDFPIQQPPASYHWQPPVELPATASLQAYHQTQLPSYGEASAGRIQYARFSWTENAEASYRPSERLKT